MRNKILMYAIKCGDKYLQGIKPNEYYSRTGTAPTMGARHCFHEYETIWGSEFKITEPLTTISYLKVLFEEYRWEEKEPIEIEIIPYWE